MAAGLVDIFEETDVVLEVVILALGVGFLEFCLDAVALCLAAAEEVYTWLVSALGEVPEGCLANAARRAYEDGDKLGWQTSRDAGVRFSDSL